MIAEPAAYLASYLRVQKNCLAAEETVEILQHHIDTADRIAVVLTSPYVAIHPSHHGWGHLLQSNRYSEPKRCLYSRVCLLMEDYHVAQMLVLLLLLRFPLGLLLHFHHFHHILQQS